MCVCLGGVGGGWGGGGRVLATWDKSRLWYFDFSISYIWTINELFSYFSVNTITSCELKFILFIYLFYFNIAINFEFYKEILLCFLVYLQINIL